MSDPKHIIEDSILTNIRIWHEVTKVKDISGELHEESAMSLEERVSCALKIREINALRSKIRWEIDKMFNTGADETKFFSEE